MPSLPDSLPQVSPHLLAALWMAATTLVHNSDLPSVTTAEIVEATQACRSRAYELRSALLELLGGLERGPGRPASAQPSGRDSRSSRKLELAMATRDFVMSHPGVVTGGKCRRCYSDRFCHFAVEQRERYHQDLGEDTIAECLGVPVTTLRTWIRAGAPRTGEPPAEKSPKEEPHPTQGRSLHIEIVLAAWATWEGDFEAFCAHVQTERKVPLGRTAICSILEMAGERTPERRQGRSPDEQALRRSFETFFPGAQWVGDGTSLAVVFEGEYFSFNIQLMVDVASASIVGASVREEEDAVAVTSALEDGVETTGTPPLAVLLDRKAVNDSPPVKSSTDAHETLLMHATRGRPQNKAHCEGSFGLFRQAVPAMILEGETKKERAARLCELIVMTWARTLNHRPRKSRKGQSRIELYEASNPSQEEIDAAKERLAERKRQMDKARETKRARQDPVTRKTLNAAFARLGLEDPTGNHKHAIARYPLENILEAIATFETKRKLGTLPPEVDGRYLFGIARNLYQTQEGQAIATLLWEARAKIGLDLRERLQKEYDKLQSDSGPLEEMLKTLADKAVTAPGPLERYYWSTQAARLILEQEQSGREAHYRRVIKRVHTCFRVPYKVRQQITRMMLSVLMPLA